MQRDDGDAVMSDGRRASISERERLAARLALGAARPLPGVAQTGGDPPNDPPSDADLAELMDGRLSGAERERVLAQLDANPDAYLAWLALGAEQGASEDSGGGSRRVALPWVAAAALAASVLAAAVIWWQWLPEPLERRIDAGLVLLAAQSVAPPTSFAQLGIRGRGGADDALARARAGYRSGLRALGFAGASAAGVDAEAAAEGIGYGAGRWIALIEAGTLAAPPPQARFWTEQARLGQALSERLAGSDDAEPRLAQTLRGLVDVLAQHHTAPDSDWRERLASRVRAGRLRLGLDWEPATPAD